MKSVKKRVDTVNENVKLIIMLNIILKRIETIWWVVCEIVWLLLSVGRQNAANNNAPEPRFWPDRSCLSRCGLCREESSPYSLLFVFGTVWMFISVSPQNAANNNAPRFWPSRSCLSRCWLCHEESLPSFPRTPISGEERNVWKSVGLIFVCVLCNYIYIYMQLA